MATLESPRVPGGAATGAPQLRNWRYASVKDGDGISVGGFRHETPTLTQRQIAGRMGELFRITYHKPTTAAKLELAFFTPTLLESEKLILIDSIHASSDADFNLQIVEGVSVLVAGTIGDIVCNNRSFPCIPLVKDPFTGTPGTYSIDMTYSDGTVILNRGIQDGPQTPFLISDENFDWYLKPGTVYVVRVQKQGTVPNGKLEIDLKFQQIAAGT